MVQYSLLTEFNRISEDEELNIILLRLLEYLGHANPYICAVAYTEVNYDPSTAKS